MNNLETNQVAWYCPRCGSALTQGATSCQTCGQAISFPETVSAEASAHETVQAQDPATPMDKKTFRNQSAVFKRNILISSILCYIGAGATILLNSVLNFNLMYIGFGISLLCFALGLHISKSKGFGISILILSILVCGISLGLGAVPPFVWLAAGVCAVSAFANADKEYKKYLAEMQINNSL